MARGLEVDIHLVPGLHDEGFVAEALGNLAADELGRARGERLQWQVLRVTGAGGHHYRLIVRHPDHLLDVGLGRALRTTLSRLARFTPAKLHLELDRARAAGLQLVRLRTVHETVDYWHDDFWNWIG